MDVRRIPDDVLVARQGIPPEAMVKIGDYLRREGAAKDGLELWPRLAEAEVRMAAALDGVDERDTALRLAGGGWSIGELAFHVVEGKRGALAIAEALLAGDRPTAFVSPDPEWQPAPKPVAELRREYLALSTEFAALAPRLTAGTVVDAVYGHPFFGELHARAWFAFQRIHDLDHVAQIEAIRAQEG